MGRELGKDIHVGGGSKSKVTSSPEYLDWFMLNPVLEGLISYADLKNGTLNLYDLFVMNELIIYKQKELDRQRRELQTKRALKK